MTLLANAYTSGRLGNRLIVSRELLAIAFEFDIPFANLAFAEFSSSFQGSQGGSIFWHLPLGCNLTETPFQLLQVLLQSIIMNSVGDNPTEAQLAHHQELAAQLALEPLIRGSSTTILKLIEACSAALASGAVTAPSLESLCEEAGQKLLDYVGARAFPNRLIVLDSWFVRVPELVAKHRQRLEAFFRPSHEHEKQIRRRISVAREGCEVLVGVHIRQTDYRTFSGGEFFVEKAQFVNLMRIVAQRLQPQRTRFLVLSDEELNTADFVGLDVVLESGPPVEDMYCLAECDYMLRSNSTFSRWAAEYGKVPYQVVQPGTTNVDDLF